VPFSPYSAGRDRPGLGILLMVASTVVFSILWCCVKDLSERYSVVEVSFFRSFFAMIPVAPMLLGRRRWRLLRVRRISGHFWRAVISTGSMIFGFAAYHLMPLSDAVAISFMAPLVLTALSVPFLGERVGIHRWSAVIVGFGGVLVIVNPGAGMLTVGVGVAIGAAVASAVAMVTIRQLNRTDAPLAIVFYFTLFSTLFTALPLAFLWTTPSARDWALLVLMGVAGGIGQYLMTRAFGLAPAAVISPFNYAGLLWATVFGWIIWGEVLKPQVLVGAAIVIASGLYILYRETRKTRALPATRQPG
jgi:drug/metabolite transporter (DMT)-like permease